MGLFQWPLDLADWVRVFTFVPLIACSVVGLALPLAKWRQTRRVEPHTDDQLTTLMALVREQNYAQASRLATKASSLPVRLAIAVLPQTVTRRESLESHTELVGRRMVRELEYGLGGLGLIATLGPLFGLLGTVVGIILVFGQLTETVGQASPTQLAGGIGTALYTTVVGLLVGVLALVSHSLVSSRVDRVVADLEAISLELIELICGDA